MTAVLVVPHRGMGPRGTVNGVGRGPMDDGCLDTAIVADMGWVGSRGDVGHGLRVLLKVAKRRGSLTDMPRSKAGWVMRLRPQGFREGR